MQLFCDIGDDPLNPDLGTQCVVIVSVSDDGFAAGGTDPFGCDGTDDNANAVIPVFCQSIAVCGDGVIESPEECDPPGSFGVVAGVCDAQCRLSFEPCTAPGDLCPPLISSPPTAADAGLLEFYSNPAITPVPLAPTNTPLNPYLDPVRNGMHEDTTNHDVTNSPAPSGVPGSFSVRSILIDDSSNTTYLLDGDTLAILDAVPQARKLVAGDASGGGYLHKLVNGDLLIATWDKTLRTYEVIDTVDGKKLTRSTMRSSPSSPSTNGTS